MSITTFPFSGTLDLSLTNNYFVLINNGISSYSFNLSLSNVANTSHGIFNFYLTDVDFTVAPNTDQTVIPVTTQTVIGGLFSVDSTNTAFVDSNLLVNSKYTIVEWINTSGGSGLAEIEGIQTAS